MKRCQETAIIKDLRKKMVFIAGPRQVGKTWLAKQIGPHFKHTTYLNYDHAQDREIIEQEAWLANTDLLILDELHKMPEWKNYLKGVYDTRSASLHILVTGSARLNLFHHVGDSLPGRYFLHHLLPVSPAELFKLKAYYPIDRFIHRGGFPEPFLAENDTQAQRWRAQYIQSLLSVDVLDFASVVNLRAIKLILELLRRRVGSPISYNAIAEDVNISPSTVKKYIDLLEALYIVFRITPFSRNIARSLLKEPKIYFFDNGMIQGDIGAKLENLVAVCLLKHSYAQVDYSGKNYQLQYLRTKDKREVDFALVCDDTIEQIIEVKHRNHSVSPNLRYFQKKYQWPAIQLVLELKREYCSDGIDVRKVETFLQELAL